MPLSQTVVMSAARDTRSIDAIDVSMVAEALGDSGRSMGWWYDPDKDASLEEAKKDRSIMMDYGPQDLDYWNLKG